MSVTPFKLLNESELQQIGTALAPAVARWREDWLGDAGDGRLAAVPASQLAADPGGGRDARTVVSALDDRNWVAVLGGPGLYGALAANLAGQVEGALAVPGEVTPVLGGALDECLDALCGEVLRAFASPSAAAVHGRALPDLAGRRGSGAAAASVNVDGERLRIVLSASLVLEVVSAPKRSIRGGLVSRLESIRNRRLKVRVDAGGVELDIASLCSIVPGDVILLDSGTHSVFTLSGAGGEPIGSGHLGALEGRKALQLTS
jgi:Type III flagellar switch regulator (C-ring) FliN C-term